MSAAATLHLVHLGDVPAQPWRNGGGVTRELLAWSPAGAAAEWVLRVSVAEIDRDGPFSAFPGVDRHFAVLQGAGVVLGLPDGEHRLGPSDPPCAFPGELAPPCHLRHGATRDLNLMTLRAAGRALMAPLHGPGTRRADGAAWRGLYVLRPLALQRGGLPAMAVPADTLAWAAADGSDWHIAPQAPADGAATGPGTAPAAIALAWQPATPSSNRVPP
jgi:uncharacterized protein